MKLNRTQLLQAARSFVSYCKENQWSLRTANNCLPDGWMIDGNVEDTDFLPLTVANVSSVYARHAVRY